MFSEILKIFPQLDNAALSKMEKGLTTRFKKAAKAFGQGMKASLLGGGIAGAALGLVDKLLNPLKETQDAIEKMLKQGDDVVTNAKQFGSTPGELFKLQKLAQATGLDADSLDVLIQKYSGAVAEAAKDPNKDTSVRRFANDTNMVDSFFQFIQSLKKMDPKDQVLVQQEVFGEKQVLKMADFMGSNFQELTDRLKLRPAGEYDAPLNKIGDLNDTADILAAQRSSDDLFRKAGLINEGMIRKNDELVRQELARESAYRIIPESRLNFGGR
jgi:hypothetical protein